MRVKAKPPMLDMDILERVAPLIRHAAHPLRLRILDFLRWAGTPQTVSQIVQACGTSQAIVSQQLRILRDQNILRCHREGTNVRYEVANPNVLLLLECIRRHGESHCTDDSPAEEVAL